MSEKLVHFSMVPDCEVFASLPEEKPRIYGYAAKYDTYSQDLGGYRTRIAQGAFDRVLSTTDCRMLINHDPNLLMGRTRSGTLRLTSDQTGLHFEADPPPNSPLTLHYMEAIRRGDMDGCSFSCVVEPDQERWEFSAGTPIRTLLQIGELLDVGPVSFPAFTDTTARVSHSLERARQDQFEAVARRARRARALRLRVEVGP